MDLVRQTVDLPGGPLTILQPSDAAELPDDREVEWAPLVPYSSVLWRSGVTLAREVESEPLEGRKVLEIGCGLAVPSLAAARAGAQVVASDGDEEAIELVAQNAKENGLRVDAVGAEWAHPEALLERGPFDLVLAADVLYERASVALLLDLLPRLAPETWLADPGRPAAGAFLEHAHDRWPVDTSRNGVIGINRVHHGRVGQ